MRWIKRLIVILLVTALIGCGDETVPPVNVGEVSSEADPPALVLIVHPYDTPSRIISRFQPLADYLQQQTGRQVKIEVALSYRDQIRRLARNEADLAYIGPTPYLRAHDHYLKGAERNLQLIAAEAGEDKTGYHSVLVVHSGSEIRAVDDVRHHTVAFGSPHSFSSHYVPRVMLARAGIQLSDLKDYAFLRRHERVALAVLHGDFDMGGLRKAIAERYLDRGLRIVEESPSLPAHVIAAAPDFDTELAKRLREILISASEDIAKDFQPFGQPVRFVPVEDSDFSLARAVVRTVENGCPREALPW